MGVETEEVSANPFSTPPDATVVIGTAIDDTLGDEVRVTIVATGLGELLPESTHI